MNLNVNSQTEQGWTFERIFRQFKRNSNLAIWANSQNKNFGWISKQQFKVPTVDTANGCRKVPINQRQASTPCKQQNWMNLFYEMIWNERSRVGWNGGEWLGCRSAISTRPLSVSFLFCSSGKETDTATPLGLEKYGRIDFWLGRWANKDQNAPKWIRTHVKASGELAGTFFRSLSRP